MKKTGKRPRFPIHAASRSKSDATLYEQTEENLLKKENLIRHVIELSPIVLVIYDLVTEHHTYFSSDTLKVYGYTSDEMMQMQKPFDVLMHPEDIPKVRENINSLKRLGDGEINEFECRIRRGDSGERRWINARSINFARDEKGEARQVISAIFDITERKETEGKLIESEKRFRSYFELGLIGMAITSPTKGCLAVNDELCKILGYERDELLNRNWAEMTHPEDIAADVANFNRVMAGEINAYRLDKRFIRKDKRIIDTTISVKCVRRADGSVDYFVALVEDITERKRAEEALRESEAKYRTLFDSIDEGFCLIEMIYDSQGEPIDYLFLETNRAFEAWGIAGATGKTALELVPDVEKRWLETYGRVAETGEAVRVEDNVASMNQWFDVYASRVGGSGSRKVAVVVNDTTERVQAEEALRQANDELERRVLERTGQLSELNEDLRKEIVERKRAEQEREQLLRRVVSAQEDERQRIAREMHDQLGQNLSALALKLSALKNDYDQQPELREHFASLKKIVKQLDADVGDLVHDLRPTALDDFGLVVALSNYVRKWSKQCGIHAELHTSGAEKDRLTGEIETALYRITQEVLTNVAKHANAENVDVLLERRPDHVSLIVEDDGDGFDVAQTFTTTLKGFGLISMRERATLVGGSLVVESNPGAGVTIAVRIPLGHITNGGYSK